MLQGKPATATLLSGEAPTRHRCTLPAMRALARAIVLIFISHSAAAQNHRGVEIIEQALASKPDIAAGAALFQEHCSSCHGARALGNAKAVTPALAGQIPLYVIKQLVDMAEREREVPEMHRVVSRRQTRMERASRCLRSFHPSRRARSGMNRVVVRAFPEWFAAERMTTL